MDQEAKNKFEKEDKKEDLKNVAGGVYYNDNVPSASKDNKKGPLSRTAKDEDYSPIELPEVY